MRCIVILTDKLIPDPDSISYIFVSKDDSVDVVLYVVNSDLRDNVILTDKFIPDPDSIQIFLLAKMIALMSVMMAVLYVVSSN